MSKAKVKLKLPKKPGKLQALGGIGVVGIVGAVVLLVVLYATFSIYIGPDQVAVRQVFLGPRQGVQKDVLGPGLHMVIPGYERYHLFPRDIQVLDFNDSERSQRSREDFHAADSIRIQTSEGYQVTVDVTVLYRVVDPYTVLTRIPGGLYEDKVVVPEADKILRQTLGVLDSEDFYSDVQRIQKAEEARVQLETALEPYGLQVWGVLIREYTYDARYQQLIEDRKIQDQMVFKNQAEAVAATREAEKNRVLAEGRANVDVEQERGLAEVRKIQADADLYYRQRVAEGDLLVALAEAEGTSLKNQALQQRGSSNIVGLKMAEALDGTEVIIVSTSGAGAVNPLDLNQLLEGW